MNVDEILCPRKFCHIDEKPYIKNHFIEYLNIFSFIFFIFSNTAESKKMINMKIDFFNVKNLQLK